uniref:F-box domain-containing protein n=1 Tax=Brassica oleracea var. oleracea TaxID=109376 RepID=A0A0D3EAR5_BRAOL
MVGQKEAKHACFKGLRLRFKEDIISQLPDPLICHILYHLPLQEAVKTSVLSTRWRSLWLWVPRLELNSQDFTDLNAFVSFGNMFFNSDRASCIHKLKLTITIGEIDNDASYVSSWIDAAIKRKVQHLDLHWCGVSNFFTKPLKLYNSETLVDLKLSEVLLDDANSRALFAVSESRQRDLILTVPAATTTGEIVTTLHLEDNCYPNEATFEKLVSSCPVLEELNLIIHEEDTKTFRLQSRSLKKLNLVRAYFHFRSSDPGVVIDAPLLCCLSIYDYASESFIVNNLESIAKIDISLLFGSGVFDERKRSNVHSFLLGITRVTDMTLCANTFEIICGQYSELDLLPRFGYMSHLHVTSRISDLKWLPTFLDSCPNSWFCDYEKMISEEMSFPFVPQCMLSSLEYVDFKVRILGLAAEMKLIRYFIENSAFLKRLTLRLVGNSARDNYTLKELLRIPRGSTNCEVVIL